MKLAFKLALVLALALTSVQVFFGLIRVQRETAAFERDSANDQVVLGRALAISAAHLMRSHGETEAARLVEDADADYTHVAIRWIPRDAIGRVQPGASLDPPVRAPGATTWVTDASDPSTARVLTLMPVHVDGAEVGAVLLSESLAPKSEYVRLSIARTAWNIFFTVAASWAATFFVGLFLIGRPVGALVTAARCAAEGDLEQRVSTTQKDEIGLLAAELNRMFDKLREGRRRLAEEASARMATLHQLRHADRLMTVGKLASGVAHELGTPLNVVLGRSKMIAADPDAPKDAVRNAEIVAQQVERMTRSIRQLLDFARQRGPERASVDMVSLVEQTIDFLHPIAKKAAVDLRFRKPDRPVRARVDASQIQQAITNVAVNGMQAMPSGGTLEMSLDVSRGRPARSVGAPEVEALRLDIRDEGSGIADEHLHCLFDPFFTTKEVGQGTGLGLSVTHGILEDHGGWIDVRSRVGEGTTFSLWIPLEAA